MLPKEYPLTPENITKLLKAAGYNQSTAASPLKASQPTIGRWMNGTLKPGSEAVAKLRALKALPGQEPDWNAFLAEVAAIVAAIKARVANPMADADALAATLGPALGPHLPKVDPDELAEKVAAKMKEDELAPPAWFKPLSLVKVAVRLIGFQMKKGASQVVASTEEQGRNVVAQVEGQSRNVVAQVEGQGRNVVAQVEEHGRNVVAQVEEAGRNVVAQVEEHGRNVVAQLAASLPDPDKQAQKVAQEVKTTLKPVGLALVRLAVRLITARMEKATAQRAEQAAQKVKDQVAQEQAQGNRKLHRGLAAYAVALAVLVLVAPHFARPSVVFNMNGVQLDSAQLLAALNGWPTFFLGAYIPSTGEKMPPERYIPNEPLPGQRRAPCDFRLAQEEINGGCWGWMGRPPPCGLLFRSGNKCYLPIAADPNHPVTDPPLPEQGRPSQSRPGQNMPAKEPERPLGGSNGGRGT